MFQAKNMSQIKKYAQESSSRQRWNDLDEWGSQIILDKEKEQNYVIGSQNINQISSFNPHLVSKERA